MRKIIYLVCFLLLVSIINAKTIDELNKNISKIISDKKATFGIGIYNFKNKESLFFNKDKKFVMMSVVKFPQAIVILKQLENGRLDYNKKIHFGKNDLRQNTYSLILTKKNGEGFDISLTEALSYTVSKSDNNVCDKLFKILGNPKSVENYFQKLGFKSISIGTDYANMKKNTIYANQINPKDMLRMLIQFHKKELLEEKNTELLWKKLIETSTGSNRIKGLLPEGAVVGHKTGTSNTDKNGVTAAFNDVGIIKLPNGNTLAIVVFISNSQENNEINAMSIAEITKAAYNFFNK